MKTKFSSLALVCASVFAFSQTGNVGINTETPSATLDVNGNVKIRTSPSSSTLTNYTVLGLNNTSKEVTSLDASLFASSSTTASNTSVFAARKTSGISLLSLGLFPTGFRAVNFLNAERTIGNTAMFSDTDNTYVVPSDGIYQINYTFRYGTGLQASLLANSPGIGIVRTRAGVSTLVGNRAFSGANLIILSLTISETTIDSVYNFLAGDRISFGLTGSTALDAGLIGSSLSNFSIYKVSNPLP